jgi:acyl phosphate:glycerol-3-phosphate acyltransferase
MNAYLSITAAIILSYLVGSLPTAYLFGRVLKGIDIRKSGSGNVGATNAWRVLGKGPGLSVLVIDVFKGVLPVILISRIFSGAIPLVPKELFLILLGLSCICGHNCLLAV